MKVNNDVNDDVKDGQKSSSIFHKCRDSSFNPCKERCKFLKFTWKFTAFTTFVEKMGGCHEVMD